MSRTRRAFGWAKTAAGLRKMRHLYYDLCCALQVLARDADWRQILTPDIAPEKILQTV